jgi:hypothetical protein
MIAVFPERTFSTFTLVIFLGTKTGNQLHTFHNLTLTTIMNQ